MDDLAIDNNKEDGGDANEIAHPPSFYNKRTERLELRFTGYERSILEERSKISAITMSEYLRRCALIDSEEHHDSKAISGNRVDLDNVLRELLRTNALLTPALNNLNQIARYVNADKGIKNDNEQKLKLLVDEIFGTLQLFSMISKNLS